MTVPSLRGLPSVRFGPASRCKGSENTNAPSGNLLNGATRHAPSPIPTSVGPGPELHAVYLRGGTVGPSRKRVNLKIYLPLHSIPTSPSTLILEEDIMLRRALLPAALLAFGLATTGAPALAQPGVTATEIKIGNTNPYSGPLSAYGTIGKSIAAYFQKVNEEGGINGRRINFVTLDDGYSPPKTLEMTRQLVEREQVLLIFQPLGTPTNSAIWKYLN